jgi:membrane protein required for colicin V production
MNGLDWLILGVLAISVLLAVSQGFWMEVLSLAGAIVGYLLAAWEYQRVAAWFLPYVNAAWVANVAGFLTVFFSVVLLAGFAGRLLRWIFAEAGLRWFDRMLGAAFGLLRGGVVATVVVMALAAFSPSSPWLSGSRLAPYLLVAGQGASWVAPSALRRSFHDGLWALRKIGPTPNAKPPDSAGH